MQLGLGAYYGTDKQSQHRPDNCPCPGASGYTSGTSGAFSEVPYYSAEDTSSYQSD
ncbi:hypothetical protein ACFLTL_00795 [Chloroflexota bacterium]